MYSSYLNWRHKIKGVTICLIIITDEYLNGTPKSRYYVYFMNQIIFRHRLLVTDNNDVLYSKIM